MTVALSELQAQVADWAAQNFGTSADGGDALLGVVEEVGELSHAVLKRKQGIRGTRAEHDAAIRDAVADIVIFLLDFCAREGIDLHEAVVDTWQSVVQKRDWRRNPATGVSV